MTLSLRQLGLLLAVGVVAMTARTAEAGFVSLVDDSPLHDSSPVEMSLPSTTSGMAPAKESAPEVPAPLHWLHQHKKMVAAHTGGPIGSGGMSSSGGVTDAPQSLSLNSTPDLPLPALVTRLVVRDEQFVPRMAISGIFRPPCA